MFQDWIEYNKMLFMYRTLEEISDKLDDDGFSHFVAYSDALAMIVVDADVDAHLDQ